MEIQKISRYRPCSVDTTELSHFSSCFAADGKEKIYDTHAQLLFC